MHVEACEHIYFKRSMLIVTITELRSFEKLFLLGYWHEERFRSCTWKTVLYSHQNISVRQSVTLTLKYFIIPLYCLTVHFYLKFIMASHDFFPSCVIVEIRVCMVFILPGFGHRQKVKDLFATLLSESLNVMKMILSWLNINFVCIKASLSVLLRKITSFPF